MKPRSARGQPLPSHAPLPSGRSAAAPGWAHAGASGVERLRSIDDFRNLRDAWQALHEACTDRVTPFNSWEWAFSWWQTYGERRELFLLVVRDAAGVAGIAPLYLARETAAPGIQASVLHIVGDGSNDSDYLGFILRPGVEAQVLEQMCDWLAAHRQWDAVALRELPEHSPLPKVLAGLARRRGWRMRIENGRCAALDLPASFEDFLRARQSRFRTKVRSLVRRIDERALVVETDALPARLRARLRSLFELHQQRWQKAGHAGVFGSVAKRMFYARFVTRFARRGWLRLYSLHAEGRYVAHELCFGGAGTTYLLQEGFDTANPSASYGQALRAAVIRDLIERGEKRYDFLGGFSRHKGDWGAVEGKVLHVVLTRGSWRGLVYYGYPLARERLAPVARWLLPPRVRRRLRGSPPRVAAPEEA